MTRRLAILTCCLLTCGCDRKREVQAPEPSASPDVDSLPALAPSLIDAPLSFDLAPVLASLEKSVPKRFGDIHKRIENPANRRMHFAFEAARGRFVARLDGDTARMSTVLTYAGRGWYKPPVAPELSASCGNDQQRPRARIEIVTPLRLSADWKLRTHTLIRSVAAYSDSARDQCKVTLLHFDVTGKVINAAENALENAAPTIDRKIAGVDVRKKFEQWWSLLQQPIRLSDTVWLAINPQGVNVQEADGKQRVLRTNVGLIAEPRIFVGRKPNLPQLPLPPQTQMQATASGFHILVEGVVAYDVASKLLSKQLRGQTIGAGGRAITVSKVRMFALGAGRIALEVAFKGYASGRIYFVGTPNYDYNSDRLYVPDLDYDVATENMLVRGLSWLKHDDLRDYLRTKARWPVGGLIKQGQALVLNGLNRELAPGVRLSGTPREIDIVGVRAAPDAVHVRARVDGDMRLDVGRN